MTEPKSETEAARRTTTPRIEVELLPAAASDDATVMERITDLTNEVYAVAEDGLWTEGATRTTVGEVAEMTRAGQIAVARLRNRIVGSVRVQRLDDGTGEFGMLVADPDHRGLGIGRELVRFAERKCGTDGLVTHAARVAGAPELVAPGQGVPGGLVHTHRVPDSAHRHDR